MESPEELASQGRVRGGAVRPPEPAPAPKLGPTAGQGTDPSEPTPGHRVPFGGSTPVTTPTAKPLQPGPPPVGEGLQSHRGTGFSLQSAREGAEQPAPEALSIETGDGRGLDLRQQTLGSRQAATGAELEGAEWTRLSDGSLSGHSMRHPSILAGESLRPEGPGLAPLTDRPLSAGPGSTPVELQVVRRVQDPGWGEELGERVVWLIGRRESLAELRLDPPELGSLEIRIHQEKDATSVHILVQSGAAREALESALPRLRELFGEAGLSLQRLDVMERQAGQSGEGSREGSSHGRASPGGEGPAAGEGPGRPAMQGEGLIDTYA